MAVVGFNFTKMSAEKKGPARGKINIKNNVSVKEVDKTELLLGSAKQTGLKIKFEFRSVYEPKLGEILFEGEILDLEDEKVVHTVIDGWKKKKKLPDDLMSIIVNSILGKCNIQALIMSRDLNMPPPIPLPRVTPGAVKQP